VKETLVTRTLGANPIVAMGVDIIEVDITSNLEKHRGGMLLKMVVSMDGRMQAKLQRYYECLMNF
jgi:hypothetical protein